MFNSTSAFRQKSKFPQILPRSFKRKGYFYVNEFLNVFHAFSKSSVKENVTEVEKTFFLLQFHVELRHIVGNVCCDILRDCLGPWRSGDSDGSRRGKMEALYKEPWKFYCSLSLLCGEPAHNWIWLPIHDGRVC